MGNKRRKFSNDFKARVAIEALKGQKTTAQIIAEHKLHPTQVTTWKSQLRDSASGVFSSSSSKESKNEEQLTAPPYKEIGRLKMDNILDCYLLEPIEAWGLLESISHTKEKLNTHELSEDKEIRVTPLYHNGLNLLRFEMMKTDLVYTLHISLQGSSPEIWRRIQVPGLTPFSVLSQQVVSAMDWDGCHMFGFRELANRCYLEDAELEKLWLQEVLEVEGHSLE
ncbi:transposase [Kiritimatiellaeota bacterium B1221]|nr:transposase [Kiritimatiellaeota bacterium B1221]